MALELHNFVWEGERLVQVGTQPHHIAGVLAEIRKTLENSDCDWEDIYSAYYECKEDGTITFYEGESAEADNRGIWTYVVYECAVGEEEVVTNLNINTLEPALQIRQLLENKESIRMSHDVTHDPIPNLVLEQEIPPLHKDATGAFRIGNSRVLLELVIRAFQDGASPESIVQRYPTLSLSDVYLTIGYYLRHRDAVEAYLDQREQLAESVRQRLSSIQPDLSLIRSRLLAQQQS